MRYRTLLLLAVFLASLCFRPAAAAADLPTLSDLVKGVSRIAVAGYPGPVQANHPDWSVIAAGTPNKERPAGFVQARPFGKGRVIAIGYEGLLQSTNLSLSDNKRFLTNMLAWLTPPGRKQIAFAEGHSEWANLGAAQDLVREAERLGYTVTGLSGALSRKSLSQTRVLVIGNAWGAFTAEEVSALTEFVQEGGGLLLAGLGWSWQQQAPDREKRAYPMDLVGIPFGIRWPAGVLEFPTEQTGGLVSFTSFYPKASEANESQDFALLERLCAAHPKDLPAFFEKDAATAEQVLQAVERSAGAITFGTDSETARRIYGLSRKVARLCPQFFSAEPTYSQQTAPTMLAVRDRFLANWVLSRPFDETTRKEFAEAARLKGTRLEIWNRFGIHLLDNNSLTETHLAVVKGTLELFPPSLYSFRFITAGQNAFADRRASLISIWDLQPGAKTENALPSDAAPAMVDLFSSALVHEIHHMIDFYAIEASLPLRSRRDALRTAAGKQDLNYVRSQITAKFFAENPLEFVASLSNAWSADSRKVLALSLNRFDRGYPGPVNQVLFMAELYTEGAGVTYFYRNDIQGKLQRTEVPVARDKQGRITRLTVDGVIYDFTLNASGDVTGYRITRK